MSEDKFPPRPGGIVADIRRDIEDAEQAVTDARHLVDTEPSDDYAAIRVQLEGPDRFSAQTITIPAGQSRMILPRDPHRTRATIWQVTSGTIVLSASRAGADGGTGAPLPSVPVTTMTHAEAWAGNTGNVTASIAVIAESLVR